MKKVKIIVLFICVFVCLMCGYLIYKTSKNTLNNQKILLKEEINVLSGDTLSSILSIQNIPYNEIIEIDKTLKQTVNFTTLKADEDKVEILKTKDNLNIQKITIINSFWKRIELEKVNNIWTVKELNLQPDVRIVYKEGEFLDGDSFYFAGERVGIPINILAVMYDLLAFEIDFERDIRSNQKFNVLYEEYYYKNKKIANGNVIAIYFEALRGNVNIYRYKDGQKVGYYDENGNGAIKSLKRTPINNAKVTSGFKLNRKHPVLGFTRAHKGVDFRASMGTPIPSSGNGTIVKKSFGKGYGNYIRIRHNSSYETVYAHMSRFVKGLNVGSKVKQGQIIGYAGATGIATGPHLHYEIIKNGQHVNPLTIKLPAIENLSTKNKEQFLEIRKNLDNAKFILSKKNILFIPVQSINIK